jgi:O-antigen/teichoic acid export membrane protein
MWSFVAMTITLVYGTFLTAKGDLKFLNIISVFGIAINVGLNFIVIPHYGAEGAAISTLFTQSFMAICQIIRVHKILPPHQALQTVLKFGALLAGMLILYFFLPVNMWTFVLECAAGLLFLFVFRLIDISRIRLAFSEKL